MKFALPATALALVALIFLWPQIDMMDTRFSIGFARLKATESEDPSMVNARYVGTDKNNQPFSITADLAKDLLRGSSSIELEMPKADLALKNGTWIALTANSGVYDQRKKLLDLEGAVNLFHDSGYEFKTDKLRIDLEAGRAVSKRKVHGQGPFGHLQAEGLHLRNGGKSIFFTGKAKLVIRPKAAGSGK
jgi:lipopolysaccharide export system protein LptC